MVVAAAAVVVVVMDTAVGAAAETGVGVVSAGIPTTSTILCRNSSCSQVGVRVQAWARQWLRAQMAFASAECKRRSREFTAKGG